MAEPTAVLPEHVAAVVQDAHDKYQAYMNGAGTLHDSSVATVAARNAVCGWLMDTIYRGGEQHGEIHSPSPRIHSARDGGVAA